MNYTTPQTTNRRQEARIYCVRIHFVQKSSVCAANVPVGRQDTVLIGITDVVLYNTVLTGLL